MSLFLTSVQLVSPHSLFPFPSPCIHRTTSSIRPLTRLTRFCREWSIYYSRPDCSPGCHLKGSKKQPRHPRRWDAVCTPPPRQRVHYDSLISECVHNQALNSAECRLRPIKCSETLGAFDAQALSVAVRQYSWRSRLFPFSFGTTHLFLVSVVPVSTFMRPGRQ